VTITSYTDTSGKSQKITAKSNWAAVSYGTGVGEDADDPYDFPHGTISSTDSTKAYAELKEGNVTAVDTGVSINETFEAMAGVPSTRNLYYATGGSEFIVALQAEYEYE
jgi:hypothetical protein